jgi:hypothetical protein
MVFLFIKKYESINFERPFSVLLKLDGCLVSPLNVDDEILWATMAGFTELSSLVERFISLKKEEIFYTKFSKKILEEGKTPLVNIF